MILDPFVAHRFCKVPETHTGNHYFSQHIISLTILTIDYHRRFTASFGVGRVLRPVRVHDGAAVSRAQVQVRPVVESGMSNSTAM